MKILANKLPLPTPATVTPAAKAAAIQVNQTIVATTPAVENVITPTPPSTRPTPVNMGVVSPSS
jgi:hypothetical protein